MRKFTYKMPLCGEYELSNLLPSYSIEDAIDEPPIEMHILECNNLSSENVLFEPANLNKNNSFLAANVVLVASGKLNDWMLCGAYVSSKGLRILFINRKTKQQSLFQLVKAFSEIKILFKTNNVDCDVQRDYWYQECYNSDGSHIVKITEADECTYDRRVIQFTESKDDSTELIITDYRS